MNIFELTNSLPLFGAGAVVCLLKAHQRQASNPFEALTCFPLLKAHQYVRVSGFNFQKVLRTSRRKSFVLYHFYNTEVQDVYLSYFTGVRWLPKLVNQRLMFRWRVLSRLGRLAC